MTLHLDLAIPPAAAPRLWRHPALAARKRPRGTAEAWDWLDSAEGSLAKAGLALRANARGERRLCPLRPPEGFALPGATLPEGSVLPADSVPQEAGEAALVPLAHFTGRVAQSPPDATGVALRWHSGTLRVADRECAVALLRLEGPEAAVLALAAALPGLPATAGLDELALALARDAPPRPRRKGAPDLGAAATPDDALALAIAHLATVLLVQAPLAREGAGPEGVHQLRVAARRLRSCLRTFRPMRDGQALRDLDSGLRDLARALGEAREWDVFLGGLGAELAARLGPDQRWEQLLRAAARRRLEAYGRLRGVLEGEAFHALVWRAARLAALREWQAPDAAAAEAPLHAQAAALLARRRRKLLRRGRAIETLDDDALHELRLDAKRLRYVAELFAPLWPGKPARRFLRRLSALQEALGLSNDAVTARALVASLGGGARHDPAPPGAAASSPEATGPKATGPVTPEPVAPEWAIGLAEGWSLFAGRDTRPAVLRAWRRFLRAGPFWADA